MVIVSEGEVNHKPQNPSHCGSNQPPTPRWQPLLTCIDWIGRAMTSARRAIGLASLASVLLGTQHAHAFAPITHQHRAAPITHQHRQPTSLSSSLFSDATTPQTPEVKIQLDANGKAFEPGAAVAVVTEVKAYGVPKAAYGTFDASGQFAPLDEANATRKTSSLVLPEEMRGEVKMVYNTNEWDRAHPILVKFGAGMDREGGGGFDVPKAFTMHFDADEIEVLS
ncbi:hypothetical protein ACHAXT_002338 [Thalassiosira profunda]